MSRRTSHSHRRRSVHGERRRFISPSRTTTFCTQTEKVKKTLIDDDDDGGRAPTPLARATRQASREKHRAHQATTTTRPLDRSTRRSRARRTTRPPTGPKTTSPDSPRAPRVRDRLVGRADDVDTTAHDDARARRSNSSRARPSRSKRRERIYSSRVSSRTRVARALARLSASDGANDRNAIGRRARVSCAKRVHRDGVSAGRTDEQREHVDGNDDGE